MGLNTAAVFCQSCVRGALGYERNCCLFSFGGFKA